MNKEQRTRIAKMVGELGDLASYKDLDTAILLIEWICTELRVDPLTLPEYLELQTLARKPR